MHAKERAALYSVLAAIALVAVKLTVGLYTNSLGVMSEALHSSIDLIAAGMTLWAVRAAARPPDEDHPYGHEKVEALSSLGETALLFITCAWIVHEAFERLMGAGPEVDIGPIAIAVMLMSMAVDFGRARSLRKAAREHKSQALEADAAHFSTDLISSAVVIAGLLLAMAGFRESDAMAALVVAGVTAYIGYKLLRGAVRTLMDYAPSGLAWTVAEAAKGEGISKVDGVRVRSSGPRTFVEATVHIDNSLPLEQGRRLADEAAQRIRTVVPDADVTLDIAAARRSTLTLEDRVRAEAADMPEVKDVHNIIITDRENGRAVEFHMEVDGDMGVREAHELADRLESRVRSLDLCICSAVAHVEPAGMPLCRAVTARDETGRIQEAIEAARAQFPEVRRCEITSIVRTRGGLNVFLTCWFEPGMPVRRAHDAASRMEGRVRSARPDVDSVSVHMEPDESA